MACFPQAKTVRLDNREVRCEPASVDIPKLRREHAGKNCPVCAGMGRLKCAACHDGLTTLLGGKQECGRCKGAGMLICEVCRGHGLIASK